MNLQKIRNLVQQLDRLSEELGSIEATLTEELSASEEEQEGFALPDLLIMPDPLRQTLVEIQYLEQASADELGEALGLDVESVERQLKILMQQGHVFQRLDAGRALYSARVRDRRPARLPADIWGALERHIEQAANQVLT